MNKNMKNNGKIFLVILLSVVDYLLLVAFVVTVNLFVDRKVSFCGDEMYINQSDYDFYTQIDMEKSFGQENYVNAHSFSEDSLVKMSKTIVYSKEKELYRVTDSKYDDNECTVYLKKNFGKTEIIITLDTRSGGVIEYRTEHY